jgi:pimeloyl-ACP methyl ester carboxylesterase
VPAANLPKKLRIQTFVNGQKRQDGTTEDLIFSIANLVKTLSEGTTLQPGDVLATGTPAGVGFGQDPPTFLKSGDTIEISVTGLGTLRNKVAGPSSPNYVAERLAKVSVLPTYNLESTCGGAGLTQIGNKLLNIEEMGTGSETMVYVHGLGGSTEYYQPLINAAGLKDSHKSYLYDLEGHGLSPTKASSQITIDTYADDLAGIFSYSKFNIKSGVLVAHSMGCLVAMTFAIKNPSLVKKLILIGPPPSPVPAAAAEAQGKRAAAVRAGGMRACADTVTTAGTSAKTKAERPVALSAVRGSLLSQNPEGYAKGCMALGGSVNATIDISRLMMPTLIITGDEDKVSPVQLVQKMEGAMKNVTVEILKDCGHWHVYEDAEGVAKAVKAFL